MRDLIEHCEDVGAGLVQCSDAHEDDAAALEVLTARIRRRSMGHILEQDGYLTLGTRPLYLRDYFHVGVWALAAERKSVYWTSILFNESSLPGSLGSGLNDILYERLKFRRSTRMAARREDLLKYAANRAEVGFWQFSAEDLVLDSDCVTRMRQQLMFPSGDLDMGPPKLLDWTTTFTGYGQSLKPWAVRDDLAIQRAEQAVPTIDSHELHEKECVGRGLLIVPEWFKAEFERDEQVQDLSRRIQVSDEDVALEINRLRHENLKDRYEHIAKVVLHAENLTNSVPIKLKQFEQ